MAFDYESLIASIPDYPEPGVVFKDITPLLADPEGFNALVNDLADRFSDKGVTKVVGAEARGFRVGAPVAFKLGAGFVPARKPGKLPREVRSQEYALEYGTNSLEMHVDALVPGDKVLLIDDLAATGGTAIAQVKLVEAAGAEVVGMGFLLELAFLDPRGVISQATDAEIHSLVTIS